MALRRTNLTALSQLRKYSLHTCFRRPFPVDHQSRQNLFLVTELRVLASQRPPIPFDVSLVAFQQSFLVELPQTRLSDMLILKILRDAVRRLIVFVSCCGQDETLHFVALLLYDNN